jgi:hypothetical protein
LCPDHIEVWSKFAFGRRESDFVFRRPENRYLLVEIERPDRKLFTEGGQQSAELTHAIQQTHDWLRYLGDHVHAMREGLPGIEPRVPCLVVMGRSRDLTPDNKRELAQIMLASPGVEIQTYDDLIASARQRAENLLGPLWATSANGQVYYLPRKAR